MEDGYFLINIKEPYGEFYIDKKYYDAYYEKYPYSMQYKTVGYGIRDCRNKCSLKVNEGDYIFESENGIEIIEQSRIIGFYKERWSK